MTLHVPATASAGQWIAKQAAAIKRRRMGMTEYNLTVRADDGGSMEIAKEREK